MDLSNLYVVCDKQRIKADAERLRQRVSNETSKIIKLKVAQDTAYWELKEKLLVMKGEHERLQKNMVDLQMQNETVSAQYQEELRHRPETRNMVKSTREICDVLEENISRVRASLQRSAADRASLAEAYTRAAEAVAAANVETEKRIANAANDARAAQGRAAVIEEHSTRLSEHVAFMSSRAEKVTSDLERLRENRDALAEKLARCEGLLQMQEKTIEDLREEMRRTATEFTERFERQRVAIAELEREAGAAATLREALAQAGGREETFAREVTRLTSELALATAARDHAVQKAETLKKEKHEALGNIEVSKQGVTFLTQKCEELGQQLDAKCQKLKSLEKAVSDSQKETHVALERAATLREEREREKTEWKERAAAAAAEHAAQLQRAREQYNEQLAAATASLTEQLERDRSDFQARAAGLQRQITEYAEEIAAFNSQLDEHTKARNYANVTINELKAELKRERSDYDNRITSLQQELSNKAEIIHSLERDVAIGEDKLAVANATIAELNAERERERRDFDDRKVALETQLTERDNAIANLKRDLALNEEKCAIYENDLAAVKDELKTARADAANAMDDVRRLEVTVRNKDNEASKQLKTILNMRSEKEQLQEKVRIMQETINNAQDTLTRPADVKLPMQREPPEHDDNAMAGPPAPIMREVRGSQARAGTPAPVRRATPPVSQAEALASIYSIFSDSSDGGLDSIKLDPTMANELFEGVKRDTRLPASLRAYKRTHGLIHKQVKTQMPTSAPVEQFQRPAPPPEPQARAHEADPPEGLRERKFFKSRRLNRNGRKKD